MFFFDIVNQTMEFIVYIVGSGNRLMANADSLALHTCQEAVQLCFREVCHHHEFCTGAAAFVCVRIFLISVHSGEITQCLIQLAVSHVYRFDSLFLQNPAQTSSHGSIGTQVVKEYPGRGNGFLFSDNGYRCGKVIDFLILPLCMGQAELDDQTVARCQCHAIPDGNGDFSFGHVAISGIDLSYPGHTAILLPHLI